MCLTLEKTILFYLDLSMLFRSRSRTPDIEGEWPSGLGKFQEDSRLNTIGAQSSFKSKTHYQAPMTFRLWQELKEMQLLALDL